MAIGDNLQVFRATGFQPAGSNEFIILNVFINGSDGLLGLTDGVNGSQNYYIVSTNNGGAGGLTKFCITNAVYYLGASATYSITGVQVK